MLNQLKQKNNNLKTQNNIYFVATPIGNLQEMTPRAIDILQNVDYIFCEHVLKAKILGNKFQFNKKLFILNKNNEQECLLKIINLYQLKKNIAIISDAGYPCVFDPGLYLFNQLIKNKIEPIIINGPCSLIHAYCCSGFNNYYFTFLGFLKSKNNILAKEKELAKYLKINHTLIFFESSKRILTTLKAIKNVFGCEINITIAKELSKKHEQVVRYNVDKMIKNFDSLNLLKGEFIIMIDNNKNNENKNLNEKEIFNFFNYLKTNFLSLTNKDKIKLSAKFFNTTNHKIYNLFNKWIKK